MPDTSISVAPRQGHAGWRAVAGALAMLALAALPSAGAAQDDAPLPVTAYNPAMLGGTGLINNPVAWVSKENGALFASLSLRTMYDGSMIPWPRGSAWDATLNIETHIGGRLSLGASMYESSSQQVGVNGRWLVHRQTPELAWLPSIAVGFKNWGSSKYQDRYATGFGRVLDAVSGGKAAGKGVINGERTVYGVLTREWERDKSSIGATLGWGTGLFKEDGGLGSAYNTRGNILTPGLFMGVRYARRLSDQVVMSLVGENDGWDYNAGVQMMRGHFVFGVMLTELEEQKSAPRSYPVANWTKANVLVGYSSTIAGIAQGTRARREAIDLELERRRLIREVNQRERRMAALERSIAKAKQKADTESLAQQAALLKALDAEREAAKKAQERLNRKPEGN